MTKIKFTPITKYQKRNSISLTQIIGIIFFAPIILFGAYTGCRPEPLSITVVPRSPPPPPPPSAEELAIAQIPENQKQIMAIIESVCSGNVVDRAINERTLYSRIQNLLGRDFSFQNWVFEVTQVRTSSIEGLRIAVNLKSPSLLCAQFLNYRPLGEDRMMSDNYQTTIRENHPNARVLADWTPYHGRTFATVSGSFVRSQQRFVKFPIDGGSILGLDIPDDIGFLVKIQSLEFRNSP